MTTLFEYDFKNGDVVENCNLSQLKPHTLVTNKAVTFIGCNCTNVFAPNATFTDCNHAQIDFCTNANPVWGEMGLDLCGPDCRHKRPNGEYLDLDA